LPGNFPAVEVISGTNDTITIRRNIIDVVLPVCKDIGGGSNKDVVFVAKNGDPKVPTNCKDADPNFLTTWKKYRLDQGGKVSAYIYDPKLKRGERFIYDAEDASGQKIHHEGEHWTYDYDINNEPMLYIIEERVYKINNGNLVMAENGGAEQPLAPNITSLKATIKLKDSTAVIGNFPSSTKSWKDVNDINLSLTGNSGATTRTLSQSVSLRNAFSAEQ